MIKSDTFSFEKFIMREDPRPNRPSSKSRSKSPKSSPSTKIRKNSKGKKSEKSQKSQTQSFENSKRPNKGILKAFNSTILKNNGYTPSKVDTRGDRKKEAASGRNNFGKSALKIESLSEPPQREESLFAFSLPGTTAARLNDLCIEDKAKIGELIKKLASEKEEKQKLQKELAFQSERFFTLIEKMKEENQDIIQDNLSLKNRFDDSLALIKMLQNASPRNDFSRFQPQESHYFSNSQKNMNEANVIGDKTLRSLPPKPGKQEPRGRGKNTTQVSHQNQGETMNFDEVSFNKTGKYQSNGKLNQYFNDSDPKRDPYDSRAIERMNEDGLEDRSTEFMVDGQAISRIQGLPSKGESFFMRSLDRSSQSPESLTDLKERENPRVVDFSRHLDPAQAVKRFLDRSRSRSPNLNRTLVAAPVPLEKTLENLELGEKNENDCSQTIEKLEEDLGKTKKRNQEKKKVLEAISQMKEELDVLTHGISSMKSKKPAKKRESNVRKGLNEFQETQENPKIRNEGPNQKKEIGVQYEPFNDYSKDFLVNISERLTNTTTQRETKTNRDLSDPEQPMKKSLHRRYEDSIKMVPEERETQMGSESKRGLGNSKRIREAQSTSRIHSGENEIKRETLEPKASHQDFKAAEVKLSAYTGFSPDDSQSIEMERPKESLPTATEKKEESRDLSSRGSRRKSAHRKSFEKLEELYKKSEEIANMASQSFVEEPETIRAPNTYQQTPKSETNSDFSLPSSQKPLKPPIFIENNVNKFDESFGRSQKNQESSENIRIGYRAAEKEKSNEDPQQKSKRSSYTFKQSMAGSSTGSQGQMRLEEKVLTAGNQKTEMNEELEYDRFKLYLDRYFEEKQRTGNKEESAAKIREDYLRQMEAESRGSLSKRITNREKDIESQENEAYMRVVNNSGLNQIEVRTFGSVSVNSESQRREMRRDYGEEVQREEDSMRKYMQLKNSIFDQENPRIGQEFMLADSLKREPQNKQHWPAFEPPEKPEFTSLPKKPEPAIKEEIFNPNFLGSSDKFKPNASGSMEKEELTQSKGHVDQEEEDLIMHLNRGPKLRNPGIQKKEESLHSESSSHGSQSRSIEEINKYLDMNYQKKNERNWPEHEGPKDIVIEPKNKEKGGFEYTNRPVGLVNEGFYSENLFEIVDEMESQSEHTNHNSSISTINRYLEMNERGKDNESSRNDSIRNDSGFGWKNKRNEEDSKEYKNSKKLEFHVTGTRKQGTRVPFY